MKFRTKLFYSFIALGLMSTLLALFIIYGEASRLLFDEIRGKILSLVINSERLVDPKTVQMYIDDKGDMSAPAYQDLEQELLSIRDINRRSDIYVEFIYLIKRDPDSDRYYFLMDIGSDYTHRKRRYGEYYPSRMEIPPGLSKPFVTTHIYSDEWGTYLSGYAPIYDAQGNELCVLGIDVETREIYVELERLLLYGLIAFAISILVAAVFAYFLSKLVSSSLSILCDTVKSIGKGDFSCRSPLHTRDEFNELSIAINQMAKGLEERERLKIGFARYVSQYALEELLKLDKPITLEGERKKVTILFTDLRDFTMMAEELPPEEVLKLLNEYYEEMIEVIFNYGGTLDKFIGDGMMVEFGAPLEDKLQELHAVLAAIHMQLHLDKLSDKWEKEGRRRFIMGVGIHTGLAVLGNIGSEKRMEYTAIGDAVNVASRLERTTKKIDKRIIISKAVYEKVKDHFIFEDLKEIEIPGRKGIIQAYSLDPYAQKDLHRLQ
ncbi:MAG: adenylate/guanylate cyclase domain-containing protein [Chlamydiia bacterium]|nr:adenylate/guanylate cyclase domain-containing protein [Chlamydiia bacterium]